MSVIDILSPHVADLIAAGEVVERPASVIKELLENAFDAGAHNVTVEIRGGGAPYIRVSDDGCGMAPEDAGLAFLRHATSKLHDERGLEAIATMGFRGEALAAIAAVSQVELRTRLRGTDTGTLVRLSAGEIQDMVSEGCPEGTTLIVRDLFFNTPARLKFLKSDRSEAAACVQTALRCALGRPEVSVRMLRDGKEEFFSPGDGRQDSCVYSLLGRDLAAGLLRCESRDEGLGLSGFISSPAAGRGSRSAQYFFCNGRSIRSPLLQAAVEQAYKNTLLTGRFPACVLYLELSPGSVDVNVHPAKLEVKFSAEKRVFDLVYNAVGLALAGEDRTAQVELSPGTRRLAQPREDFYRSMSARDFIDQYKQSGGSPGRLRQSPATSAPAQTRLPLGGRPGRAFDAISAVSPRYDRASRAFAVEKDVQNVESPTASDHKILGEAMKTYILVERGEELILIDKHAAHERLNFDRLRQQSQPIMAQSLLSPLPLHVSLGDGELLQRHLALLEELGFGLESLGETDFVVRAVPYDIDPAEAPAALEEICERLRDGKLEDAAGARDEILHTIACKAAIKAGWDTQPQELERLVEAVLSGQVKYCPHGRPVSAVLSRRELDKMFKRIV